MVLIFLLGIETFAVQLLLQGWNGTVAWVLTGISIYSGFQLLGIIKSIPRRPIKIKDNQLHLRWGIMTESTIKHNEIKQVVEFKNDVEKTDGYGSLSPFRSLEGHNVLIITENPVLITGIYGTKQEYTKILLHVDQPQAFIDQLTNRMESADSF